MKTDIYKNYSKIMVRTPTMDTSVYSKIFDQEVAPEKIEEMVFDLSKNAVFRESILVASENLYKTLCDFSEGKKIKKKDYFLKSIYKYIIRMTTRSTPFGLFSAVGFAELSDKEMNLTLAKERFTKHIRIDTRWIMTLIKNLEEKYYDKLDYIINDGVLEKGERAALIYSSQKKSEETVSQISIRLSEAFEIVQKSTKEVTSYEMILNKVKENYGEINDDKIKEYLRQLVQNEYLVSSLRPKMNEESQLNNLIHEMEKKAIDEKILSELKEIKKGLEEYSKTNLGFGEELLKNIIKKMKDINEAEAYVQVDTKLNIENNILNNEVVKDLNKLMDMVLKMAKTYGNKNIKLEEYTEEFLNKYDMMREVPVLELLDNDKGIGAPRGYRYPENDRRKSKRGSDNRNNEMDLYFRRKYYHALRDGTDIVIKDEELAKLNLVDYEYNDIPIDLDLFLSAKRSGEEKDSEVEYHLGASIGSSVGGRSFGRFSHIMNDKEKAIFSELNENIMEHYGDDYVTCEMMYLPNDTKRANVTRNSSSSQYELNLLCGSGKNKEYQITLDDIYIGIENNKFYARSERLNKRIIFTANNLLNIELAPNHIRFLQEISSGNGLEWWNFPWNQIFNSMPYVPAVKYNKFVLSPKTWTLDKNEIGVDKKTDIDKFEELFMQFRTDNKLGEKFFISSADNKILINANSRECIKILLHELNNSYVPLALTSAENFENDVLTEKFGEEEMYVSEFVVPLRKKKTIEAYKRSEDLKERINNISNTDTVRIKYPFQEWLYFNLYGAMDDFDDLIAAEISEFSRDKVVKGEIDKYFFMRYIDTEHHVRLRFRADQDSLLKLYPEINQWLTNLIHRGVINRFTIEPYEREVERYGGVKLIDTAEDIFFRDSIIVEDIIKISKHSGNNFDKEKMVILSIIHYLKSFNFDLNEQVDFLRLNVKQGDYRDAFKQNRKELMKLCDDSNDWENLRGMKDGSVLLNVLDQRKDVMEKYCENIENRLGKMFKKSILNSLIHLHCNRVFGIDRDKEKKVLAITSHVLYAIKGMRKKRVS